MRSWEVVGGRGRSREVTGDHTFSTGSLSESIQSTVPQVGTQL